MVTWNKSRWTLAQVMVCCLTAPSHYLNQCWLIINKIHWHSSQGSCKSRPPPPPPEKSGRKSGYRPTFWDYSWYKQVVVVDHLLHEKMIPTLRKPISYRELSVYAPSQWETALAERMRGMIPWLHPVHYNGDLRNGAIIPIKHVLKKK